MRVDIGADEETRVHIYMRDASGVTIRELVADLSKRGLAEKFIEEFCSLYGFALHLDADVQFRLNAKSPDNLYAEGIWRRDPDTGAVNVRARQHRQRAGLGAG